ncbi:winged helix-turn-helix transcriptional regulator [Streptomyces sp. MC1]|uniref:MarR family winged helix-turn-helix transcriptional regulator n=1 Tax=unclassified Streptomyces TaxID=2593676 RepID=UPI0004C6E456|nr:MULTISPECIES: MarR family winged helix-turn-helix transcriptional regulator [unclassified Streptomyces]MBG7702514.1 winged helix-turn-helix transcriptional regulator [Streptomyces sp. MC1]
MHDVLANRTGRSLQREFGLSGADYTVLAELTRVPDGEMQMLELARILGWEKSRLSHHLTRMERRGLIERTESADDRRRSLVAVTWEGREAITAAAPRHVDDVRRLFLDHLTPGQITLLAEISDSVLEKIGADD